MHTHAHIGHVHQHTQVIVGSACKLQHTCNTCNTCNTPARPYIYNSALIHGDCELQHPATPCNTLDLQIGIGPRRLQTATTCNTLHHSATPVHLQPSRLRTQRVVHWVCNQPLPPGPQQSELQHTAAHCIYNSALVHGDCELSE